MTTTYDITKENVLEFDLAPAPEPTSNTVLAPPEPMMDPRFVQRRVMVVRERGKRRLHVLIGLVSVLVAVVIAYWAVHSPFLDIDRVNVSATRNVTSDEIRVAAGVDMGSATLFADLGAIASRVEKLPWVAEAHVTRAMPGTIRIKVRERVARVWARRPSGPVALIDRHGRIVDDVETAPVGIPELRGLATVPKVGAVLASADGTRGLDVLEKLPAHFRSSVFAVEVVKGQIKLAMGFGLEVRLGDLRDIATKAAAAEAVIRALPERARYVDVRVPGAPAVG